MPNPAIFIRGTTKTVLNANGPAVSNTQLSSALGTYSSTDTSDYPHAEFVITTLGSAGAATEFSTLDLYVRELNIDGTNDEDAPATGASSSATTFKGKYLGSFVMKGVATAQTRLLKAWDNPKEGELYLYNNATGQTLAANWTLKMIPFSIGPST